MKKLFTLLRRGCAFSLAALALWTLFLGAGAGAAAGELERWVDSGAFAAAVLRTELGEADPSLPFWQRLAVDQSPLLRSNPPGPLPTPAAEPPVLEVPKPPDPDGDMAEVLPQAVPQADAVVEQTLVPVDSEGYVTGGGLYLNNRTDLEVDLVQALNAHVDLPLSPASRGPQVLILHTHATEAYTPDGEDRYIPSDNSRTLDESQNMLRIGDELERVYTSMGLEVLHDRTLYDYPKYAGSYSRSGPGIRALLEQYPTLSLVLDVHRDALIGSDGTVYKAVTDIDGVKTAQVLLVVGTGKDHPRWQENLALAAKLQKSMDTLYPTLARPMTLRQSAYNQDLCPGALLVEVGCHGNTLQEALSAARAFARSSGAVLLHLAQE